MLHFVFRITFTACRSNDNIQISQVVLCRVRTEPSISGKSNAVRCTSLVPGLEVAMDGHAVHSKEAKRDSCYGREATPQFTTTTAYIGLALYLTQDWTLNSFLFGEERTKQPDAYITRNQAP